MLRPNIWVEKIEKLPSRVEGWLRLSAARTRSDWSKTFPARFFENGRVEGRGGGGRRGHCYRIVANLGHDRICCPAACLRHIQSKFSSYNRFPAPLPQRIFFVSVLMLIFCARHSFCPPSQRTPHFLWTCSQNPNPEMTRRGNLYFHEESEI